MIWYFFLFGVPICQYQMPATNNRIKWFGSPFQCVLVVYWNERLTVRPERLLSTTFALNIDDSVINIFKVFTYSCLKCYNLIANKTNSVNINAVVNTNVHFNSLLNIKIWYSSAKILMTNWIMINLTVSLRYFDLRYLRC